MDYTKYREELLRLHSDLGLLSSYTEDKRDYVLSNREGFIIREAWCRYVLACIYRQINPDIELRQHPHFDTFDADIYSGRTIQVEGKCRNYGSDRYPTDNISVGKGDEAIREGGQLAVFFNDDGVWRVYDFSEYRPGKSLWRHKKWTSPSNDLPDVEVEEECWELDPSMALYEGKLIRRNGGGEEGDS